MRGKGRPGACCLASVFFLLQYLVRPLHGLPDQTRRSHLQLCPSSRMTHQSSLRSLDVLLYYFQRHQGLQPRSIGPLWLLECTGALHGSWRNRQPPKMRAVLELVELGYLPMVVNLGPNPLCMQAKSF